MNYYRVVAKCGHVGGPRKYIPITHYTVAADGKAAARIIRAAGRVKHDRPDAILSVTQIDFEEYFRGRAEYAADPYTNCRNVQEQKLVWEEIAPRVVEEDIPEEPVRENNAKRGLRYGYVNGKFTRQYWKNLCA